jgi:glycyl-tRNA synthetase beta chain
VLRARFEDGSFYYYEDLKAPLDAFVTKLARVQFQRELGSVLEKVARVEALSTQIASKLKIDAKTTACSAHLCKADLVSGVVAQFPELQGIMGSYYAEKAGESADVVKAIREHYWPRFSGDALPSTDVGCMVSLGDKLDTLTGVIGIGKAPKGNADPFALRRAAIAVARIIIERGYRLSLDELVALSLASYGDKIKSDAREEIAGFIVARARGVFTAHTTLIDGAMASGSDDLADLAARIEALAALQKQNAETFAQLAAALKRAGNIVAKAVADKVFESASRPDMSVLQHASEKQLLAEIEKMQRTLEGVSSSHSQSDLKERYVTVMSEIAGLKPHVDRFFDDVMVMVDDAALRIARLSLLNRLQSAARVVADFTRVQL